MLEAFVAEHADQHLPHKVHAAYPPRWGALWLDFNYLTYGPFLCDANGEEGAAGTGITGS